MKLFFPNAAWVVFALCLVEISGKAIADEPLAGARKKIVIDDIEFVFRWCPSGEFTMGSRENFRIQYGEWYIKPHEARLTRGYWMLETEVTQTQYEAFMDENPSFWKGRLGGDGSSDERHSVEQVTWDDANRFCERLSESQVLFRFRLPSEMEWERACRADSEDCRYGPIEDIAWVFNNTDLGEGSTGHRLVRQKLPNAWGLYDMLGNVSEWCHDWHGPAELGLSVDSMGPMNGNYRIVRGGNCMADIGELARDGACLAGARSARRPDVKDRLVGFRIVAEKRD